MTDTGAAGGERVLVVDDNADMRDYLASLLAPHWRVEAVAYGVAALDRAVSSPPDLFLVDVMMPGMDGFELLRRLRADPRTRSVPVVMLSARAGEEATVEELRSGADDYLVKPFAAGELMAGCAPTSSSRRCGCSPGLQRSGTRRRSGPCSER